MKKLLFLFFATLTLIRPLVTHAQAVPPKPDPPRLVNDFAHVMTPDQVSALEHKLVNYDDSTSNQIVIVTEPTIGDADINEYSTQLFNNWGIGNKHTNNGVLIFVAVDKHQVFINVGTGLQGAIPDVTAKAIIDNEIIPNFRSSTGDNYYRGFDQAADALVKAAAGEYKATNEYANRGRRHSRGSGTGIGIFFIIFVIIIVAIFRRGGGGGGGGGYFGGGGFLPFLLGTMVGRGFGSGGGWGGGGGGGWSGGGDSGGGFGGFGGGSSDGGGAGGSW
ncbi:TPM domain-containing protein [Puia dinghuensis]|uniref:TPM domain-containing protein n=1 Tax=Puia dinghuensis TaxID=1792502 RepID=A0A8J2XT70_9BACT|nr:TPM domain-containing protein [Puia dinghuensis]GGB01735.1 hypothetical protein GCM10011511_26150 [Puia dinghuensis]